MNQQLLEYLMPITQEEQAHLNGRADVDRDLYTTGSGNTVTTRRLLEAGKLITLRTHTRFVDFPAHTHDYVEVVYMCSGETTHIVNNQQIRLKTGELLFLSQSAVHQVRRAELKDVAVNFIVQPLFFTTALSALGDEETPLRRFLVDCLFGHRSGMDYLHFQVAGRPAIQSTVETLLWTLLQESTQRRKIAQMTMAVLFLQLLGCTEELDTGSEEENVVVKALRYIESDYASGSLAELAEYLHYDVCALSRKIKQATDKTFTQLLQEKRLAQAAFLLRNTSKTVADISAAVGYENVSYFHRIFYAAYGKSPREYRCARKDTFSE